MLAAFAAGCGDDSEPAKAGKGGQAPPPISYKEAKEKVDIKELEKGEVTIRNKWGNRVQCDVPGYRGGAKFGIDESSAKIVRADEVDGKKIVDVTCGDQRVSALNVTPTTEGADLEYINEITFRQSGFNYVHSHLDFRNRGCEGQDPHTFDWAASRTGSCIGTFLAGSPPYLDDAGGVTTWERLGGSSRKPVPSSVRGLAGPNESLIKITNARTDRRAVRADSPARGSSATSSTARAGSATRTSASRTASPRAARAGRSRSPSRTGPLATTATRSSAATAARVTRCARRTDAPVAPGPLLA